MDTMEIKYLERLAEIYPTMAKASTEIINLQAIMSLPKSTEHFLTDIHGEYEAFSHVLKNGSGSVKRKIDEIFGHTLSTRDKRALATLIYYPREKMKLVRKTEPHMDEWYRISLYRLIEVCKRVASKYTRSKVRKALPEDFSYVIEELITEKPEVSDKEAYYEGIIDAIIQVGNADKFIIALSELIQRLVVDHLHVLGDIFDRGPGPHNIMDKLMEYHSVDVQWGNHDILWMGAAAGQRVCIATVIRICARYSNLDILEDGYGINLLPLATFTIAKYGDDACECFQTKGGSALNEREQALDRRMHKAIAVIAFKLEGQLIKKRPEFGMQNRLGLERIDYEAGTIEIEGKKYALMDTNFPTIDPADPYRLTEEEEDVMERLVSAFLGCDKLQNHMQFLLKKGSLYKVYNGNLLYHGCVPLDADGSFSEVEVYGKKYRGKALYDVLESYVRKAFFAVDPEERERGQDIMWYIWSGPGSPMYGKHRMATLERYLVKEKETHLERKNPYYQYLEDETVIDRILDEFQVEGEERHIINGHVPVHHASGESPVKCNGKLLVIDGGFSRAYQKETGIAGYTLIFNSWGLILAAHQPFQSTEEAIASEADILSDSMVVHQLQKRLLVGDTDEGARLKVRIRELQELLKAYRSGILVEHE